MEQFNLLIYCTITYVFRMQCNICAHALNFTTNNIDKTYSWTKYYYCNYCQRHVCICVICPKAKHMYTKRSIANHQGYHSRKKITEEKKRKYASVDYDRISVGTNVDTASFSFEESESLANINEEISIKNDKSNVNEIYEHGSSFAAEPMINSKNICNSDVATSSVLSISTQNFIKCFYNTILILQ